MWLISMPVTKVKLPDFSNRAIGIINFERLSPNFIADTMNWFLNSMSFLSVAWPTGVQLLVFFCSSVPVMLFGTPGISGAGRNTFLSSPHLCFIIVFICDLFVSRDDPLMS